MYVNGTSLIRTRFAVNDLHIGNMRTAIYNYLFAKRYGGSVVLRIDDCKKDPYNEFPPKVIAESMKWLGLNWDEGPVHQKNRKEHYAELVGQLIKSGHAYPDDKNNFNSKCYRGVKRNLSPDQAFILWKDSEWDVRFKVPENLNIIYEDLAYGRVGWNTDNLADPVIMSSKFLGGFATRLFAGAVDDAELKISHVIRSNESLNVTPLQILIMDALGYVHPFYAHIKCVFDGDKKLSKRNSIKYITNDIMDKLKSKNFSQAEIINRHELNPINLSFYETINFNPKALFNYLAKLGWSIDGNCELESVDRMTKVFSIKKLDNSIPQFDYKKLEYVNLQHTNEHYLNKKTIECTDILIRNKIINPHLKSEDFEKVYKIVNLCGTRLKDDNENIMRFAPTFYSPQPIDREEIKKHLTPDMLKLLPEICSTLLKTNTWTMKEIGKNLTEAIRPFPVTMVKLIHALRTCLGVKVGLFEAMEILGKLECVNRIRSANEDVKNEMSWKRLFILDGHNSNIIKTGFNCDNNIITASNDNTIKIWDIISCKPIHTIEKFKHGIEIDPSGKFIAYGSHHSIKIISAIDGKELYSLHNQKGFIHSIAINENGDTLVAGGDNFGFKVYDLKKIYERYTSFTKTCIWKIVFHPDGKRIIVSEGHNGEVNVWTTVSGKKLFPLEGHTAIVGSIATTEDHIVTGGLDNTIRIWDASNGKELKVIQSDDKITCLTISPDKKFIVVGQKNSIIKMFTFEGKEVSKVENDSTIYDISFNKNSDNVITGDADFAKVWKIESFQREETKNSWRWLSLLKGHKDSIHRLFFTKDNKVVSASFGANLSGSIKIHDLDGNLINSIDEYRCGLAISPDEKQLTYGSTDDGIKIIELQSGKLLHKIESKEFFNFAYTENGQYLLVINKSIDFYSTNNFNKVFVIGENKERYFDFSIRDNIIAVSQHNKRVLIYNMYSGQKLANIDAGSHLIYSVALSVDGKRLAVSNQFIVTIYDIESEKPIHVIEGHKGVIWKIIYDSKYIFTSSGDNTVRVWDANTFKHLSTITGHDAFVGTIDYNGKLLVSGSADKTIKIWEPIPRNDEIITLEGHKDFIYALAFTPDGKTILSGDYSGKIKKWDAIVGEELLNINNDATIHDLKVSNNGKFFVTNDNKIRDVADGQILQNFKENSHCVAISPSSKLIVSGGESLKVWDVATGEKIATMTGHTDIIKTVTFSTGGSYIVSAGRDKIIRIWGTVHYQELHTACGHTGTIHSVIITNDSKYIISGSADKTVRIWNISGKEIKVLKGHTDVVFSVACSHNAKYIASASADNTIKIWSLETFEELVTLRGHADWVQNVAFSPNDKQLISCGKDHTVKMWDIEHLYKLSFNSKLKACLEHKKKDVITIKEHDNWHINDVIISPDGNTIASLSHCNVTTYDMNGIKIASFKNGHLYKINAIAFSPNSIFFATGSEDNKIIIWNTLSKKQICTLTGHRSSVKDVAITCDGNYIVSSSEDTTVRVWDYVLNKQMIVLPHESAVNSISVHNSRVACSAKNLVMIWNLYGKLLHTIKEDQSVSRVNFSRDGKRLIVVRTDHTFKIYNTTFNHQAICMVTMGGHQSHITQAVFSPDDKYIVTSSNDKTIKIWNAETYKEIRTLTGHDKPISGIAVSKNNIVSGSWDETIKIWGDYHA